LITAGFDFRILVKWGKKQYQTKLIKHPANVPHWPGFKIVIFK